MLEFLLQQVHSNQFLSGGLVMGIMAAVFAQVRSWPAHLAAWLHRRLYFEVDITERNEVFAWVEKWASELDYSKRRARRLTMPSRYGEKGLNPAPGTHWFWYKHRLCRLTRDRKEMTSENSSFGFRETFLIRFYLCRRSWIEEFLSDVTQVANPDAEPTVDLFREDYSHWGKAGTLPRRDPESVILPQGESERIFQKIQAFFDSRAVYRFRGIPWRIGFLFAGLPGSGKTSLVNVIASKFNLPVYVLTTQGKNDEDIANLASRVPPKSILLLEDVDTLFSAGTRQKRSEGDKLTFSGLLNAIDGMSASEGRVLIMTTNHPENLDPALVRPGRIDVRIDFASPNDYQREQEFLRFFPNENPAEFVRATQEMTSMAQIQQALLERA